MLRNEDHAFLVGLELAHSGSTLSPVGNKMHPLKYKKYTLMCVS